MHLHWIGGFVDYESFFRQVKKPLVWTIHDENPGLGGFHYSSWKDKAPATFKALDDKLIHIKKEAYEHIASLHLVAISTMMADYFRNNELLRKFPSTIIFNGINDCEFYPVSRDIAKEV